MRHASTSTGSLPSKIASRLDSRFGLDRELIAELESTIDDFPLRERLRTQLMLALYRSGRQTESLRAFQDFRSYLIEEAGLEPSEELHALEESIVQRKQFLDLPLGSAGVRSLVNVTPDRTNGHGQSEQLERALERAHVATVTSRMRNPTS